jgi:hypothetical protein
LAASLIPPQKIKAANDRASTSCEASFVLSPAGEKIKSKRPSCTRHDKSGVKVFAKASACVPAKVVMMQSKRPLNIFHPLLCGMTTRELLQ